MRRVARIGGVVVLLALILAPPALGHAGRRFQIQVVEGGLVAQGINTTGTPDGAPATRPYVNAIHDHWRNVDSLGIATASLPGFDVPPRFDISLLNQRLELELTRVRKWVNPPSSPPPGTIPLLEPLSSGELLSITGPSGAVSSAAPGVIQLVTAVPPQGAPDLDLVYQINSIPNDELYVVEFILRAFPAAGGPATIRPSSQIHVILAPDHATPNVHLHGTSLFLEAYMATVPEPASIVLIGVAAVGCFLFSRPRRSTSANLAALL